MAGFNFAPITVQPQQQTSLADMMNIARNAQAYQQAQQINPLQLEQAKANLLLTQTQAQKAQAAMPYELQSLQNQAALSGVNLNDAQLKNIKEHQANSSRNLIKLLDTDEPITPEIIKDHVVTTMKNAGATDQAINQAIQNLPVKGTDKELRVFVAKHALNSLTAENELDKRFPSITMQNLGGTVQPVTTGNPTLASTMPGTKVGETLSVTPTPGVSVVNGLSGQYNAQGVFVPFAIQPNKAAPTEAPITGKPETQGMPKIVQIDNFKAPGQFTSQETDRYAQGAEDFKNINQRETIAKDSSLDAANIRRSISAASGTKPGQILRDTGQMLFGDPQKDLLVKNLAANALRQSALMGVKNQSAEGDVKTANGSEQITAEALAHIIERIDSTNLAAQKYNQALIKFQEKHGKDKAYLNNDNFKAAWADAYNPIAFIIQNTNRQNIPQKDKDKIIDYYTSGLSQKQLNELHDSQVKLKRLERGDF